MGKKYVEENNVLTTLATTLHGEKKSEGRGREKERKKEIEIKRNRIEEYKERENKENAYVGEREKRV